MTAASVPPVSTSKHDRDASAVLRGELLQEFGMLPSRRSTAHLHRGPPARRVGLSLARLVPLRPGSLQTAGLDQRFRHPGSRTERTAGRHAVLPDPGLRRLQSEHFSVHPRPGSAVRRLQSLVTGQRH